MAASGYTPIQLYYSTTASATPTAGNLANGELAINITDGKLYYKDNTGTVKVIAGAGGAGVAGGSNTQVQYNSSGSLAGSANMTFDGTTLTVNGLATTGTVTLGDASGDALTINSSAVSIPNGLNFDSNTFVIDATNNNVGIGTASPASFNSAADNLVVGTTSGTNGITIAAGSAAQASIFFADGTATGAEQAAGYLYYFHPSDSMVFGTSNTERMRITSTGNVGIGTSSPSFLSGYGGLQINGISTNSAVLKLTNSTTGTTSTDGFDILIGAASSDAYVWQRESAPLIFGTAATERMRIDSSGNVGIGTSSPSYKTTIQGSENTGDPANPAQLSIESSTAYNSTPISGIIFRNKYNSGGSYAGMGGIIVGKANATDGDYGSYLALTTRANGAFVTERMRLDSSGNLGLGVTPSAWGSGWTGIDVSRANLSGSLGTFISRNAYYNGTNWIAKYTATESPALYSQPYGGGHNWSVGNTSVTAGNAITFTQAMTLDASGNLGIGDTSPSSKANFIVYKAPVSYAGLNATAVFSSTASQATGVGGLIAFEGQYGSGDSCYGAIGGLKENSTSGNYAGYLAFYTRANGSLPAERMRIDSDGNALFAKAVRATITTDNDLSFDMNAASNFKSTPTAGGALTFTNITSGQTGNIILVNGSNYAITAAATTKVSATCLATISATGTYWLSYYSDGTNVYVANTGALA